MAKKTKSQYILEAIDKIHATTSHLEKLLKNDVYTINRLSSEVKSCKEMIHKIYENRRDYD